MVDNHDWIGPRYPTPALDNVHKSRHLCLSQVFDLYRYPRFLVRVYPALFLKMLNDKEKKNSKKDLDQDHSIMDEAVPSFFGGKPLYIRANIE